MYVYLYIRERERDSILVCYVRGSGGTFVFFLVFNMESSWFIWFVKQQGSSRETKDIWHRSCSTMRNGRNCKITTTHPVVPTRRWARNCWYHRQFHLVIVNPAVETDELRWVGKKQTYTDTNWLNNKTQKTNARILFASCKMDNIKTNKKKTFTYGILKYNINI